MQQYEVPSETPEMTGLKVRVREMGREDEKGRGKKKRAGRKGEGEGEAEGLRYSET